jgi:hypothetical protein
MKTNIWLNAAVLVSAVVASVAAASAQEVVPDASPAAFVNASVPHLPYGTSQILQLTQAKLGDDTVIAYIKNSGNSYRLNADQIIYLRQQGFSDAVLTAMLSQPRVGLSVPVPSTPAPQPVAAGAYVAQPSTSTATVVPSATYAQTAPYTTYYYPDPYYSPYYYYPGYVWYPSVNFGWGWGWRGGGNHIGYGGYHGGGFARGGHGGGRR